MSKIAIQEIKDHGVYRGWYEVFGDFSEGFKNELKSMIPRDHWEWDGHNKRWLISEAWAWQARQIARKYFTTVEED
jgi:hypothetical protein